MKHCKLRSGWALLVRLVLCFFVLHWCCRVDGGGPVAGRGGVGYYFGTRRGEGGTSPPPPRPFPLPLYLDGGSSNRASNSSSVFILAYVFQTGELGNGPRGDVYVYPKVHKSPCWAGVMQRTTQNGHLRRVFDGFEEL